MLDPFCRFEYKQCSALLNDYASNLNLDISFTCTCTSLNSNVKYIILFERPFTTSTLYLELGIFQVLTWKYLELRFGTWNLDFGTWNLTGYLEFRIREVSEVPNPNSKYQIKIPSTKSRFQVPSWDSKYQSQIPITSKQAYLENAQFQVKCACSDYAFDLLDNMDILSRGIYQQLETIEDVQWSRATDICGWNVDVIE